MSYKYVCILVIVGVFSFFSCGGNKSTKKVQAAEKVYVPTFSEDSAYQYVKSQVDFGPRVPNTKEHVACGNYLAAQLASFGAKVYNQYADLIAFDGTILKSRNIIGAYQPELKKRVVLFAHWDSRKWSDNDPDAKNHHKPILGANDGASGVGVLLEIARQINLNQPKIGVDIVLLDSEDYGAPQFYKGEHKEEYWGLGAQYWAKVPHVPNYNARFGILLDMVGAEDATFFKEYFSVEYAKNVVDKVWKVARRLGYGQYFINQDGGAITDDHVFVNQYAKIPTIDIVPNQQNAKLSSFGDFWHTQNDNMNVINKKTLKAVGQTVLEVIYNEK